MPKLPRTLAPLVRTTNTATTPLPPKVKDAVYTTPEYQAWRTMVVAYGQVVGVSTVTTMGIGAAGHSPTPHVC